MNEAANEPQGPTQLATRPPASEPRNPYKGREDAISALTMTAYAKASTLQLTPEEIGKMQADFPDDAFRKGASGKDNLIYIEHAHLRDRMNVVFGPGQWAIIPRNRWTDEFTTSKEKVGIKVYVEAMLLIRGCFVAEAVGDMDYWPKNDSTNFGDAVEGAKTAALRRCAKELGIGLQAWKKGWCDGWWQRNPTGRAAPSNGSDSSGLDEAQAKELQDLWNEYAKLVGAEAQNDWQPFLDWAVDKPGAKSLADIPSKRFKLAKDHLAGWWRDAKAKADAAAVKVKAGAR